jgi:chemotaxis protein MotA
MELMALLYDILQKARKEGLMSIEKDVEEPHESPLFRSTRRGQRPPRVEFITDYLRMMVSGNLNAHEIESLMDSEIETHHQEGHAPWPRSARLAGGLPAFGIVAAVLGVVNTMGSVGQPPAVLGGMIGSALVGTFLGILLAYGFVEPLAACSSRRSRDGQGAAVHQDHAAAAMQGYAPQVAVEFGRKVAVLEGPADVLGARRDVKGKR